MGSMINFITFAKDLHAHTCTHTQSCACARICMHSTRDSAQQNFSEPSNIHTADRFCKKHCLSLFVNQVMSPQSHWGLNPSRVWLSSFPVLTKELKNLNSSKNRMTGPQLHYILHIKDREINITYFSAFCFHFESRSEFSLWKMLFYQLFAHMHWWF